jgi:hypothetical protein
MIRTKHARANCRVTKEPESALQGRGSEILKDLRIEHVDLDMVQTFQVNANSCASAAVPKPAFFGCFGQEHNKCRKVTAAAKVSNMLSCDSSTLLGMGVSLVSGQVLSAQRQLLSTSIDFLTNPCLS